MGKYTTVEGMTFWNPKSLCLEPLPFQWRVQRHLAYGSQSALVALVHRVTFVM